MEIFNMNTFLVEFVLILAAIETQASRCAASSKAVFIKCI